MGNASTKLILREDKARADGTAPVYLRVTKDRRTRQRATGVWVEPKSWNAGRGQVRRSHPLAVAYNARLGDLLNEARVIAGGAHSAAAVVAAMDGATGTFTAFLKQHIAALREEGKRDQAYNYEASGAKWHATLCVPWPEGTVPWSALTPEALDRFARHCRRVAGNHPNTVRKDLMQTMTLCRRAVRLGVLKADGNPFLRYTLPPRTPTKKRRLTLAEIEALRALDLELGSEMRAVRDAFLVAVYAHGMRVSDLVSLKLENVVRVEDGVLRLAYRAQKTGKLMEPKLPPVALPIVRPYMEADRGQTGAGPYIFPIMRPGDDTDRGERRRRQKAAIWIVNSRLKKLGEAAGIGGDGLTSHVARHSFADAARKSGDLYAVSKALGHSSLSVTQAYLSSFDRAAVDALSDSLWNANK